MGYICGIESKSDKFRGVVASCGAAVAQIRRKERSSAQHARAALVHMGARAVTEHVCDDVTMLLDRGDDPGYLSDKILGKSEYIRI